jgi:hypothetical protein
MFKQALIAAAALAAFVPVAASAGEVQNRINNENARINQGVDKGSLTFGEYRRLDAASDHIQWQRNRDLRQNDGRLTPGDYRQLNHEENNLSDRIYFDKHNLYRQH